MQQQQQASPPFNHYSLQSIQVSSFDLSKRAVESGRMDPEKFDQEFSLPSSNSIHYSSSSVVNGLSGDVIIHPSSIPNFEETSFRRDRYQKIVEQKGTSLNLWPIFAKFYQARDFKVGEYKTIIEIDCKTSENPSAFLMYFMSRFNSYSHKHVVPILDTYITKNSCCIVTPYFTQGSMIRLLKTRLEKQKFLKIQQILCYFSQLLEAINYIHNNLKTTMYGGISLDNIFMDETLENISLGYVGIHIHTMNLYLNNYFNKSELSMLGGANLLSKPEPIHNSNNSSDDIDEKQVDNPEQLTKNDEIKDIISKSSSTSEELAGWQYLDIYACAISIYQLVTLSLDMSSEESQNLDKNSLQASYTYQLVRTLQQQQQLSEEELSYWKEYIKNKIGRVYHNKRLINLLTDMLNISQSKLTAQMCIKLLKEIPPEDDDDEENAHY